MGLTLGGGERRIDGVTDEQQAKRERGVALFDFDGTLVPWDTQLLFADFVLRKEGWRRFYLGLFAVFGPFYRVLGDEGMKRVFLSYLWRAEPEQVAAWAREFVENELRPILFPEVLARLERHREAGELVVLVSASPDFYICEVGKMLGCDLAYGTPVEMVDPMRLFPDLVNHKGAVKVARIAEVLGESGEGGWSKSHGYTDSCADLPMMRCCEQGTVVNPSERLLGLSEDHGWEVMRVPLPWKGRLEKWGKIAGFALGASNF